MPVASSVERAFDVPGPVRAAMVALGWIPGAHLLVVGWLAIRAVTAGDWRLGLAALAALYLVPPLAVRLQLAVRPMPTGRVELASGGYLRWWATAQWQILFARLPWLEELLRMVPGLYSAWLRLWGARIGSLVYWSPGVTILDRPLVRVGHRVAFGTGVRINPHVVAPRRRGRGALFVAPVTIGDDALIGGYSILVTGCEVDAGEVTPPFRSVHPYTRLAGGRRLRVTGAPDLEDVDAS